MSNYNYVNTKMGSFNHVRYSNGNCYPVCAVPHGMNFFTVQTESIKNEIGSTNWFYSPLSRSFEGIRLTHMPSPWLGDYGKLLIYADRGLDGNGTYWSSVNPEATVIEPSYMRVYAKRDRYTMELTPSNTSAIIRFSFDKSIGQMRIVFAGEECEYEYDENADVLYIENSQCSTTRYFANKGFKLKEHIVIKPNKKCSLCTTGGKISLITEELSIELRLATSYISREQAMLNLEREAAGKSFDELKSETERVWKKCLSKINITDSNEEAKSVFYSCLYRAFLWPRRFYEINRDGKPVHVNTVTCEPTEGVLYVDNGFWDTYRTLYPFLSLVDTELYAEIAEGFYNHYKDTGWLPKWLCPVNVNCMPGMLIEATMADAIVKDIIKGELAENVLSAMLKDGEYESEVQGEGRVCLGAYRKYGYIPYTLAKESVNETLDNCFGDFAIAMAARKLGKDDIAERYFGYAKNYEKLFDKESGFIRGKDENGAFRDEVFNPYMWGRDYTEGSAWQNAFGVYHDIVGLDALYDGKLCDKIDELMSAPPIYDVGSYGKEIHEMSELAAANYGQCAISNQPSFHIPFIYSELGHPEKTSYHIERLCKLYSSGIEGFPGDEDNGSASSWYLLSAMGLYQVAPSRPDFATAAPIFEKMSVELANGNILYINKEDYDVSSMKGKVSYFDVMKGGELARICSKK